MDQLRLPADFGASLTDNIYNAFIAIVILLVGWVVALALSAIVRWILSRLQVDQRLARVSGEGGIHVSVESWASTAVFYLTMLFVLAQLLSQIGLDQLGEPLGNIGSEVAAFLPNILAAAILFVVAWLVANIVRLLISRVTAATRIDDRLGEHAELGTERPLSVSSSLANAAYWLTFLFFLPSILNALQIEAGGVEGMLSTVLQYLPRLVGAAIILFIGWFVARIVRQVVSSAVAAAGGDNLGARLGISGGRSLSSLAGTIVYAFILIPVAIAALDKAGVAQGPTGQLLNDVLEIIPKIVGSAVLLGLAYWAGSFIADLVSNILQGVGLNRLPAKLGFENVVSEGSTTPSDIAGTVTLAAILLFAASAAATNMGFGALASAIDNIITLGGQSIIAVVILAGGAYLANLARSVILNTMGTDANWVSNLARGAILVGAVAMALGQIDQINDSNIVQTSFQALAWAIALATAIAFGWGGRGAAADIIEGWRRRIDLPSAPRPASPPNPAPYSPPAPPEGMDLPPRPDLA